MASSLQRRTQFQHVGVVITNRGRESSQCFGHDAGVIMNALNDFSM